MFWTGGKILKQYFEVWYIATTGNTLNISDQMTPWAQKLMYKKYH